MTSLDGISRSTPTTTPGVNSMSWVASNIPPHDGVFNCKELDLLLVKADCDKAFNDPTYLASPSARECKYTLNKSHLPEIRENWRSRYELHKPNQLKKSVTVKRATGKVEKLKTISNVSSTFVKCIVAEFILGWKVDYRLDGVKDFPIHPIVSEISNMRKGITSKKKKRKTVDSGPKTFEGEENKSVEIEDLEGVSKKQKASQVKESSTEGLVHEDIIGDGGPYFVLGNDEAQEEEPLEEAQGRGTEDMPKNLEEEIEKLHERIEKYEAEKVQLELDHAARVVAMSQERDAREEKLKEIIKAKDWLFSKCFGAHRTGAVLRTEAVLRTQAVLKSVLGKIVQQPAEAKAVEVDQLEKEAEAKAVEVDQLEKEPEGKAVEVENLEKELEAKAVEVQKLQKELEAKAVEVENLKKQLEAKEVEVDQLEKEAEAKAIEVENLKKELEAFEAENSLAKAVEAENLRKELQAKVVEVEKLLKEQEAKEVELQCLSATCMQLEAAHVQHVQVLKETMKENKSLKVENTALHQAYGGNASLKKLHKENVELSMKITDYKDELWDMEQQCQRYREQSRQIVENPEAVLEEIKKSDEDLRKSSRSILKIDLQQLEPHEFLGDEIMEVYPKIVNRRMGNLAPRLNLVSSFFYTWCKSRLELEPGSMQTDSIQKMRGYFQPPFSSIRLILMPIHGKEHWSLCVIQLEWEENRVDMYHLDSIDGHHNTKEIKGVLTSFFEIEWSLFFGKAKKGTITMHRPQKIVDDKNEQLQALKTELGEEVYQSVSIALTELDEYNASERCPILVAWNSEANRRATMGEVITILSDTIPQKKELKRVRLVKRSKP